MKDFIHLAKNQHTHTHKYPLCLSSMRQLKSGFDKASTFALWRATLPGFDNDLLQPATIFTITDLPGNQGYGHSDKSIIKTASSLIQTIAISVLKRCQVHNDDMQEYQNRIEQNEDNAALLKHLKVQVTSDPLDFSIVLLLKKPFGYGICIKLFESLPNSSP